MTPRLHVLLGAGGVGKTTLAAGYALALARDGRRVGLLGIDPSRRLQAALGVALSDLDAPVPGAGLLRAAIVHPHQAIDRWIAEPALLAGNPFFVALGDRLATAIDILAAARIAEWLERDPELTDLVVDTAPGLAAIDFLRSPAQIEALITGRLVRWLRAAAQTGAPLGRAARRVIAAFSGLAGARMVLDLATFFAQIRAPLETMLARVERTRRWLASDAADLLLVTSPRDADARGAAQLRAALAELGLGPRAVIVNRTWPVEVAGELAGAPPGPFADYVRAYLAAQARVIATVVDWGPLIEVPQQSIAQRGSLAALGARITDRDLYLRSAS